MKSTSQSENIELFESLYLNPSWAIFSLTFLVTVSRDTQ